MYNISFKPLFLIFKYILRKKSLNRKYVTTTSFSSKYIYVNVIYMLIRAEGNRFSKCYILFKPSNVQIYYKLDQKNCNRS